MTASITLPGRAAPLLVAEPGWAAGYPPPAARRAYAAAHVAATASGAIDWAATIGFQGARRADRLRCRDRPAPRRKHRLATVTSAYEEQAGHVEDAGARVILMASRALAASARSARDYLDVYGRLLMRARQPVILHLLGEAFDPALRGYWGAARPAEAAGTVLELIDRAGGQVDGVKLSLLDAGQEIALRRRLPPGVRLYTGDDFHYDTLIRGDDLGHSDALLGAFAAVTAPAAAARHALDAGDVAGYAAAIGPTVALSRAVFERPTFYYKVGVASLAWLNGLQPEFAMVGGLQRHRSAEHPGCR